MGTVKSMGYKTTVNLRDIWADIRNLFTKINAEQKAWGVVIMTIIGFIIIKISDFDSNIQLVTIALLSLVSLILCTIYFKKAYKPNQFK